MTDLKALSDAATQGEWQPIETARKYLRDSQSRLIWCPGCLSTFCAYWQEGGTPGYKSGWAVYGGGWRESLQDATHWMPLPTPPVSEED